MKSWVKIFIKKSLETVLRRRTSWKIPLMSKQERLSLASTLGYYLVTAIYTSVEAIRVSLLRGAL
jgi:hypothetical protein